jgi:hypothetical protein
MSPHRMPLRHTSPRNKTAAERIRGYRSNMNDVAVPRAIDTAYNVSCKNDFAITTSCSIYSILGNPEDVTG